ncbi:hypothetical protein VSDG_09504 [Cytospora chrysosperma]|uniref:Uncharacterized protein n=1 Tax=Cytospora chrysosperma TaxID=252740 RepID=A0A423VCI9_CYTCH|nr:hypothetical protein VSDG_09504 [Valsa sordida]
MPPYPSFIANYNLGHPQTSHHVGGYVTSVVAPAAAATTAIANGLRALRGYPLAAGDEDGDDDDDDDSGSPAPPPAKRRRVLASRFGFGSHGGDEDEEDELGSV